MTVMQPGHAGYAEVAAQPRWQGSTGCRLPNGDAQLAVIGRRLTATFAPSVADVQRSWNLEARPFVPAALKTLFSRQPSSYSATGRPLLWPGQEMALPRRLVERPGLSPLLLAQPSPPSFLVAPLFDSAGGRHLLEQ